MKSLLIGLIRSYQYAISPLIGPRCRSYPSCLHYTLEAIRVHDALRGDYLGVRRLLRCYPWHPGGHDPIPERQEQACACHRTAKSDEWSRRKDRNGDIPHITGPAGRHAELIESIIQGPPPWLSPGAPLRPATPGGFAQTSHPEAPTSRHPFSPSSLAVSVFCAATPAFVALQPIAEASLAGETEFRCQFNADNSTDCVGIYNFTILKSDSREMLPCIDRNYAETDSLIVERAELTQSGGKPVPLDQSQIDARTAPNLDQGFLRKRQTSLAFFNLRVGTRISYALREHFTAKPPSTQFHYIPSRPPTPVRDDRFVAEFRVEQPIFVHSELMDAYRIEQGVDKKTLKVSLKKPQYTNYINEAGNAYLCHTPRLELGSSLDLQDNSGPLVAHYNEILAAELPKGAAAAVAAAKGKLAREQVAGLMQYINDTYRYLGGWRASKRGYVPLFLVEIERNGYGDCKGLVIPLAAMLKAAGIKVEPTLVSRGDMVWNLLVLGMYAPNHAIIRAEVDGKIWRLDPTNLVFTPGRTVSDIQQRWALVLGANGKVRRDKIPLEVPGDILCATRSEYYTHDGEAWVESCVELSNAPLTQLNVADRQRGRIGADQDLCRNFTKEGSDCVLERDDSQLVPPSSYTISARLIDRRTLDWLGGEYFYNHQDLTSQWDVFAKYRSEGQSVELHLGEPQITPYDTSLSGGKIDESVYSYEIRSPRFDIDLQAEPVKDGGYHYRYREMQKTSWLNHDEISSVEFGKLTEQNHGCAEQLCLVVKLDKRP